MHIFVQLKSQVASERLPSSTSALLLTHFIYRHPVTGRKKRESGDRHPLQTVGAELQ